MVKKNTNTNTIKVAHDYIERLLAARFNDEHCNLIHKELLQESLEIRDKVFETKSYLPAIFINRGGEPSVTEDCC